jgi:citrate lyase subunit beta/citryl-CoA lyase/(S)-citramalyl-CoA lyase
MNNPRRCLLFVPGTRPERFEKALATGADQVCIDLEDAVPLSEKVAARDATFAFIAARHSGALPVQSELGFRINAISTDLGLADLRAVVAAQIRPAFIMLPKVEDAGDIQLARSILGAHQVQLIGQLESPRAVFEARSIAKAGKGANCLQALMFGGFDYAVAARVKPGAAGWAWARGMIAAAAAEVEVGAIDAPSLEIKDAAVVESETMDVIELGFTGKSAIHPAQVDVIQHAYLPTAAEVAQSEKIIAAIAAAAGTASEGAIAVDGKLVDRPIELAARRIVELAKIGTRNASVSLARFA